MQTTSATIDHTYTYGGTFQATLTVADGTGNQVSDTAIVTVDEVNDPPIADAGGPYSGFVGAPVTLDASGSSDFDNQDGTSANDQTLTYHWDFGDGTTQTTTSPSIAHTYQAVTSYPVTLTVSDGVTTSLPVLTTVSIDDPPVGDPNVIYISDISFELKTRGKNIDWRVVVTVRRDSDADGLGTAGNAPVVDAQVTLNFAGQTFTGQTNSAGVFETNYVRNLGSGSHVAEVTELAFSTYDWDPQMLVVDTDGDGIPDDDLDSDGNTLPDATLSL